ncbi:MAG: hypothetical protein WC389_13860 [Lutibacter sp.]|jgi:hypothetical protein
MNRILNYKYTELIQEAYSLIPQHILDRLPTIHFFTGTNMNFAGLVLPQDEIFSNRFLYYISPSIIKKALKIDDNPTIVIPDTDCKISDIIHEIGHAISECLKWNFTFDPTTEYVKTDQEESFAEAFVYYRYYNYEDFKVSRVLDEEINTFFDSLWRW